MKTKGAKKSEIVSVDPQEYLGGVLNRRFVFMIPKNANMSDFKARYQISKIGLPNWISSMNFIQTNTSSIMIFIHDSAFSPYYENQETILREAVNPSIQREDFVK